MTTSSSHDGSFENVGIFKSQKQTWGHYSPPISFNVCFWQVAHIDVPTFVLPGASRLKHGFL